MKTGLIMEGGAMRGMFTCGVIDVMQEAGITFDGAIGVSAGAVLGCNYKSEQIGRAYRYTRQYCKDYRYGSMKSFRKREMPMMWISVTMKYRKNWTFLIRKPLRLIQ